MALFITHVALSLYFTSTSAKVLFELCSLVSDALQGIKGVRRVSSVHVQLEYWWQEKQ